MGLWACGIFMFFGLLQFWFAQNIFGDIGKKPILQKTSESSSDDEPKFNLYKYSIDNNRYCICFRFGLDLE